MVLSCLTDRQYCANRIECTDLYNFSGLHADDWMCANMSNFSKFSHTRSPTNFKYLVIATFAKYPNFIQMPINLEYLMIATFSKYAKFIQMPINFEHCMIATFAKHANFILRKRKQCFVCFWVLLLWVT